MIGAIRNVLLRDGKEPLRWLFWLLLWEAAARMIGKNADGFIQGFGAGNRAVEIKRSSAFRRSSGCRHGSLLAESRMTVSISLT